MQKSLQLQVLLLKLLLFLGLIDGDSFPNVGVNFLRRVGDVGRLLEGMQKLMSG
jgi:hypothetical protein